MNSFTVNSNKHGIWVGIIDKMSGISTNDMAIVKILMFMFLVDWPHFKQFDQMNKYNWFSNVNTKRVFNRNKSIEFHHKASKLLTTSNTTNLSHNNIIRFGFSFSLKFESVCIVQEFMIYIHSQKGVCGVCVYEFLLWQQFKSLRI